ncbi:hypothetical protein KEM60_02834 [Austwickia sp. TVS 96-490-7B]|uniref:MFS transporter n=1 Tax=Austwickia sp. TVS 96-490-7B TaxID=2830843 RepID=UPI001C566ADF|nr:MFS transporter [Austwickia sp. TVS 96-490-7B]MBW3086605.1 hypothetical protein [Austwickia sp. TVS 96-490-7B]
MTSAHAAGLNSEVPADRQMIRQLWPLLIAAALGLIPFTVMSTFLVPIATDAESSVVVIGGFRGLGGVAALIVGAAAAPLVDRMTRGHVASLALVILSIGCLVSLISTAAGWVIFCLLIGAGTSLLSPALSAMAADRYDNDAASGRAATIISATTTLTAVLAAPLLAAPALLWGWQGDMVAASACCVVLAVMMVRLRDERPSAVNATRPGYGEAFRTAARVPGGILLISISALRTTCFMGQLAYVAAYYAQAHSLDPGVFSLVWTLSGASFFCGNWWAGRALSREDGPGRAGRLAAFGALLAGAAHALLFCAPWLPAALIGTSLTAVGHAIVAAAVVTLLVRRAGPVRGTVMSLNGSAQSLGVFIGAALVGACLAGGNWTVVGVTLAAAMVICAALALAPWQRAAGGEPR